MKMLRMIAPALIASMSLAIPQTAMAESEWPMKDGNWVEVTGVRIDDGHYLDYAKFLAGDWRKSNDFAVKQGWISSYEVMWNTHPRRGEPDVYLIVRFPRFPTPEEGEARAEAYRKHMVMTDSQMQAASGERADYRHVISSMLLRSQIWK